MRGKKCICKNSITSSLLTGFDAMACINCMACAVVKGDVSKREFSKLQCKNNEEKVKIKINKI